MGLGGVLETIRGIVSAASGPCPGGRVRAVSRSRTLPFAARNKRAEVALQINGMKDLLKDALYFKFLQ